MPPLIFKFKLFFLFFFEERKEEKEALYFFSVQAMNGKFKNFVTRLEKWRLLFFENELNDLKYIFMDNFSESGEFH